MTQNQDINITQIKTFFSIQRYTNI